MKKIISISTLCMLVFLGSCKKFLDEKPLSQASLQQFYKNKDDVDAAMAGMYSAFQSEMVGSSQYTEKALYWGEYRADNFDRHLPYTKDYIDEVVLNSLTPTNDFSNWSGLYKVISRANNNLKYIPAAAAADPRLTQDVVNRYLAESYGLRAISYFYLVRVWGDAPIWLEPYEDLSEPSERAREPKEKIINEVIIPDLQKAFDLLPKEARPVVFNISRGAVSAIMADVYMWKKDYPKAIEWIQKLFESKGPTNNLYGGNESNLESSANWKTIFTNPSSSREAIWSIHWDYVKNGCACMQTSWTENNKQLIVDEQIWSTWFLPQTTPTHTADIRPKQTLDVYVGMPGNKRDRFIKWYPTAANPTAADPWPATNETMPVYFNMYRLGGMYLLYAEALNGNNDPVTALKYLNYVRKRAGLPEYLATDPQVTGKAAMEDAILQERQWELFGEGKRWFDLVRTGHAKEVMDPILKRRQTEAGNIETPGFVDPENRVYWPIHRDLLNTNKKLIQNEGYTD